jgi:hypothetical protein
VLAACGSPSFTNVAFRNDLGRPVQLGLCRTDSCRSVEWWIGVDPDAVAVQQVRSRETRRFVVAAPPDAVYGCFSFRFDSERPDVAVALSKAHGCGSGR